MISPKFGKSCHGLVQFIFMNIIYHFIWHHTFLWFSFYINSVSEEQSSCFFANCCDIDHIFINHQQPIPISPGQGFLIYTALWIRNPWFGKMTRISTGVGLTNHQKPYKQVSQSRDQWLPALIYYFSPQFLHWWHTYLIFLYCRILFDIVWVWPWQIYPWKGT